MILVTGASGFLGQHLLQALATQPLPVVALYNSRKPEVLSQGNISWKQCDLLDVFAVEEVMKDITRVYHCAAVVSFDARKKDLMIQGNVAATANVVNAALDAGVEKLVHVSSIAALGRTAEATSPGAQINEDTHWEESKANSAYAESKFQSEMEVWRAMAEGLNAAIVNPAIILGEGDWNSGSANLMQIVYDEFPWYTEGINAWVDVKDVVAAMVMIMDSDISDERYIVSAGNFGYKEVFTEMALALNRKPPHKKASAWMTEIVWRMEVLKSRIAGKQVTISKESARTAQTRCNYSNEKLPAHFPAFKYRTLKDTVSRMAAAFLSDKQ